MSPQKKKLLVSSSGFSLLLDIVYKKKNMRTKRTVEKDVKDHRITVRFSSQGAPFNLTKF